jgi:hypothetical protein
MGPGSIGSSRVGERFSEDNRGHSLIKALPNARRRGDAPRTSDTREISMKPLRVAAAASVAGICIACGQAPLAPLLRASLVSDQSSYEAIPMGTGAGRHFVFPVVARYANESDAPIYLSRCLASDKHPNVGVRVVSDDAEAPAFDPPGACAATSALQVAPGELRTDTLSLEAPVVIDPSSGAYTGPQSLRVESFYLASTCASGWPNCPAPFEARTSNVVTVRMPQ